MVKKCRDDVGGWCAVDRNGLINSEACRYTTVGGLRFTVRFAAKTRAGGSGKVGIGVIL